MKIAADATERVGVKSGGLRLSVEAHMPSSASYSWTYGAELIPKVTHAETKAVTLITSGTENETNVVGVWIGGEFQFSRKERMFWKFQHSLEKNLFGGTATLNDPVTSSRPSGVVVNQSQTFLEVGYTFGN
jgi:hypothetical protein